jgi:hypothetical protein
MLSGLRPLKCLVIAAVWLTLWYSVASAHGGIAGPDELGPPVIASAILGIGGYWTVMLWPTRRKGRGNGKKTARRAMRSSGLRY